MRFKISRVRSISTVLILLIHAPFTRAQPLPDRTSFGGRIENEKGQPIGGASVSLRRQNEVGSLAYWGGVLLSDARGNFTFSNAEGGTYLLSVGAAGFADIRDRPVVVGEAGALAPIRLQELANFRAQLSGPDGAPIKSARFSIAIKPVEGLGRADAYWQLKGSAVDGNGAAPFVGFLPGRYDIVGAVPGVGYFEAKDVSFAPGNTLAPFAWQIKKGGVLKVSAQNAAGKALGGIQVSFVRIGDSAPDVPRQFPGPEAQIYGARIYTTRDGDGLLEIPDLAPGQYKVSAISPGAPVPEPQTVAVEGGKTTEVKWTTNLANAASFAVKIIDTKDAPRANSDVVVSFVLSNNPAAVVGENAPIPARILRRARTDANGIAMLYPIVPGRWQVSAWLDLKSQQISSSAAIVTQIVAGENNAAFSLVVPDETTSNRGTTF